MFLLKSLFISDKSYLERLMDMDIYQPKNNLYDKKVVTKLTKNYRSNKHILEVSNGLFYNNELTVSFINF